MIPGMNRAVIVVATLVLGSCSPAAIPDSPAPIATTTAQAGPHIVGATATEDRVTIVYDRPMMHALACGTKGLSAGSAGTIDGLEMNITSRYYTSSDQDFEEMWANLWEATLNADCTGVTFNFVHGIGPGTYPLRVVRVQDFAGRALDPDPTVVTVTVAESGPPRMNLVQFSRPDVLIRFSEAIKTDLATDVSRYRVDGRPLATGSTATCRVRTCAEVALHLANAPDRVPNDVTVVDLRDLAGNPFAPGTETQPIALGQGQSR
jgi:hypothetical protein